MKPLSRPVVLGLLLVMSAAAAQAIAGEPMRLDGSSDSTAERSFKQMMDAQEPDAQMQLATAMLQLNMAGVSSAEEMMADPELRNPSIARIREQVDGLTAEEIIALASGSGVETFIPGREPGIDAELLAPLSAGPVEWSLAGTTWLITSDVNGHISELKVQLDTDGRARILEPGAPAGRVSTWQQSADEFLLSLNDEFVAYRGRLEGQSLTGTAGNVNGTVWSWTAKQLDSSSAD